jgi:hypothetical protein
MICAQVSDEIVIHIEVDKHLNRQINVVKPTNNLFYAKNHRHLRSFCYPVGDVAEKNTVRVCYSLGGHLKQ